MSSDGSLDGVGPSMTTHLACSPSSAASGRYTNSKIDAVIVAVLLREQHQDMEEIVHPLLPLLRSGLVYSTPTPLACLHRLFELQLLLDAVLHDRITIKDDLSLLEVGRRRHTIRVSI